MHIHITHTDNTSGGPRNRVSRPDATRVWDLHTHFRKALPDAVTIGQHFKAHGSFVQGIGKIFHGGRDNPQETANVADRPDHADLIRRLSTHLPPLVPFAFNKPSK